MASGVSWSGASLDDVINQITIQIESLTEEIRHDLIQAGEDGATAMEFMVATRGTAKSGKQGRIETGALLDSIDSRVTKDTKTELEVEYGYIKGTAAAGYDVPQEYGFHHYKSGVWVDGIHALRDSAIQVEHDLEKLNRLW